MNREKQIEEIAKVIDKSPWKLEQDFTGCHINSSEIAESLYNAGYRKQSEVAKEIFKDLDEMAIPEKSTDGCAFYFDMAELTELGKKYVKFIGSISEKSR